MKPIEFIKMINYEGLDNIHMTLVERAEACDLKTFIKEELGLNPDAITVEVADGYDADCGMMGWEYIAAIYEDDAAAFVNENGDARICAEYPADVVIMNGEQGVYLYDLGSIE